MTRVLLPLREVMRRTGLGKTTIYALQREGKFPSSVPAPSRLRGVRWIEDEVDAYVNAEINAARRPSSAAGVTA